jgi:hypothetical protein
LRGSSTAPPPPPARSWWADRLRRQGGAASAGGWGVCAAGGSWRLPPGPPAAGAVLLPWAACSPRRGLRGSLCAGEGWRRAGQIYGPAEGGEGAAGRGPHLHSWPGQSATPGRPPSTRRRRRGLPGAGGQEAGLVRDLLAGGGAVGEGDAACRPPSSTAVHAIGLRCGWPHGYSSGSTAGQQHSLAAAARRYRWEDRLGRSGGQHGGGAQGGRRGGELATPSGPTPGNAQRCWLRAACISSRRYMSMEASVSGGAGGGAGVAGAAWARRAEGGGGQACLPLHRICSWLLSLVAPATATRST